MNNGGAVVEESREKKGSTSGGEIVLEFKKITKRFPGVVALEEVDLDVGKGEVHAIVGENGAGKSTLCNILTGIHRPTQGEIYWKGKPVQVSHPSEALRMGIAMVYQERNLIPYLTGAQNICLGQERIRWGIIDEAHSLEVANQLRERVGAKVPLNVPTSLLGASARQMIEILRALAHDPELLILDEPTSSLDRDDIQALFHVLERIKKEGRAVIFISHKLEEVFSISDRISVFRDGQKISTNKTAEFDTRTCIKHMINREMVEQYPEVKTNRGEKLLEAKGVSDGISLKDITLQIHKGEVVGLYGLVGSGRTEFAEVIFGLRPLSGGQLTLGGAGLGHNDSTQMRIEKGIFLIPEDRRRKAIWEFFNVRENMSIAILGDIINTLGLVKRREEKNRVNSILKSGNLRVVYRDMEQEIDDLSGGNKQKVIIGRWLARQGLKLLIMDEPTQGIDVGAKREIYNLTRDFVEKQGIGVVFISSELPELIGVCDRMYVFREGTVAAELSRQEFDREKILFYALPGVAEYKADQTHPISGNV